MGAVHLLDEVSAVQGPKKVLMLHFTWVDKIPLRQGMKTWVWGYLDYDEITVVRDVASCNPMDANVSVVPVASMFVVEYLLRPTDVWAGYLSRYSD